MFPNSLWRPSGTRRGRQKDEPPPSSPHEVGLCPRLLAPLPPPSLDRPVPRLPPLPRRLDPQTGWSLRFRGPRIPPGGDSSPPWKMDCRENVRGPLFLADHDPHGGAVAGRSDPGVSRTLLGDGKHRSVLQWLRHNRPRCSPPCVLL